MRYGPEGQRMQDRFVRYTEFNTQSSETADTVPSSAGQVEFAQSLREELAFEGFEDIELSGDGYLYATLPANPPEGATADDYPTIGFISHYDTSPDFSGDGVKARLVERYDGKRIELGNGVANDPEQFPELLRHIGEDLIVTDGATLLGADDKAGIAEIITAACWLRDHREATHGKVRVAFTPDEETGRGAERFNVAKFGCDWAYTVDGGDLGELEYENFNAASARISVNGVSVHPGYAKGKMRNAARIAAGLAAALPEAETPENTAGREGFYHVTSIKGNCEKAEISVIIRDHDSERFKERKAFTESLVSQVNAKYGEGVCEARIEDQYHNMLEQIRPVRHIVELAEEAMREAGVEPKVQPIRGGTDGAQLSFKGLPCPNIFTGAVNFHGPHEFVSVQVMEKAVQTIVNIIRNAERK